MKRAKVTVPALVEARAKGQRLSVVTAYDATVAALLDEAGVDALMVGDSLGMVVQGRKNTLAVTLEEMIYHLAAVSRVEPSAHIVGDLPFLSYQISPEQALHSAGRLVREGGAESVKLEGGRVVAEAVMRIVRAGIPVMGHIGLTPQSVHALGGFRVQGRTTDAARALVEDARALEAAGAFSIVVEGVPSEVGELITESVKIPTIGIGAGPHMSGQVLVCYDLLGMYRAHRPKFVKAYAELGDAIVASVQSYIADVRSGAFPAPEHGFAMQAGQSASQSPEGYGPGDEKP
jgi:3-methyl-2-oxobutanoate hydroxymethyltransferase